MTGKRAAYCASLIARVCNLQMDGLFDGTAEWIARYESDCRVALVFHIA